MRSASVAPVWIDGRQDAELLLEMFIAYWIRSKKRLPWISADEVKEFGAFFDEIDRPQDPRAADE